MQTIGRNAIRVVRPSSPHTQVVHHVRTYGPGMSDGESVGIVVRISPAIATIGEPGQRRCLKGADMADGESAEELLLLGNGVVDSHITLIGIGEPRRVHDVVVG